MFKTEIARFVTRPGSGNINDFDKKEIQNEVPDLIMGTFIRSGAHLLKSNTVYELALNELTGVIELQEIGESNIGKYWGHAYYDIQPQLGKMIWLTKDEYKVAEENGTL